MQANMEQVIMIDVELTSRSLLKNAGYERDNPGGAWLESQQIRAKAGKTKGDVTASTHNLMVDVADLIDLPGLNGEHLGIPDSAFSKAKIDGLASLITTNGYHNDSGIMVWVDVAGKASIAEGNHRIRASKQAGLEQVPVQFRWFAGSEDSAGNWGVEALTKKLLTSNAFCPTGKGGGIDNTCGSADKGGGSGGLGPSKAPKSPDAPEAPKASLKGSMAEYLASNPEGQKGITKDVGLKVLQSLSGLKIDTALKMSEDDVQAMAKFMTADVRYAMDTLKVKPGWYDQDIKLLYDTLAKEGVLLPDGSRRYHKELGEEGPEAEKHKFIFASVTALTSPGADVLFNVRDAEFLYNHWKTTGKLEALEIFNGSQTALKDQLSMIDATIKYLGKENGTDGLIEAKELFSEKMSVRDIRALGKEMFPEMGEFAKKSKREGETKEELAVRQKEYEKTAERKSPWDVKGEAVDAVVPVFGIFGPKLGAFQSNLSRDFSNVTIDMWEMRHLGGIAGNALRKPQPDTVKTWAKSLREVLATSSAVSDWAATTDDPKAAMDSFRSDVARMEKDGTIGEESAALAWGKVQFNKYYQSSGYKPDGKWSKTYGDKSLENRLGKTVKGGILGIQDAPQNSTERQNIRRVFEATKANLKAAGIDMPVAEIQALSWSFIQRSLKATGVDVNIDKKDKVTGKIIEKTFSEGARRMASGQTEVRTSWKSIDKGKPKSEEPAKAKVEKPVKPVVEKKKASPRKKKVVS